MPAVKKLIEDLREKNPAFRDAESVVDKIRDVARLLERMRIRSGLTQAELGQRMGLSPGRVSQLESGALRDAPSLKTLVRFAQACGETIAIVASGESQEKQSELSENMVAEEASDPWTPIRDDIAALRAETRQELSGLRAELATLKEQLTTDQQFEPFDPFAVPKFREKGHVVFPQSPARSHTHQGVLLHGMVDYARVAHSMELATQCVLNAAGIEPRVISADTSQMKNDQLKITLTVK